MARGMLFPAGIMVLIVVLVHEACSGMDSNRHEDTSPSRRRPLETQLPPDDQGSLKRQRHDSSNSNNKAQSTITSKPTSAGEDSEAPLPKRQKLVKDDSSNSNNEAPSTITSKITSSGEAAGSIKPQLEEIPPASVKLVMKAVHFDAHFQVLEVMQKQISTLIDTMKEVHSAFNDHLQGIQFADPVDRK